LSQLDPIAKLPKPIAGQGKGLGITINPADVPRWPAPDEQGFRVPPYPDGRVEVAATRPRAQDVHHLMKQDREVPALDG